MKIIRILMMTALVGVLVATGYWQLHSNEFGAEPGQRIGTVVRKDIIQRVTIAGTIESARSTIISAPYDGYIKKVFVKLGQTVKEGDSLISIAQSLQADEPVYPIRSPFSGTVTQVAKSEGEFVKQGDPKGFVVRIDDLTEMFVHANAPEIDILKIHVGFETDIKASAILSQNYKGIVTSIAQAAIPKEQWGGRSQVEYLVKIKVTDADANLKPGMSAVVDVITSKKNNVLTLPHEFIHKEQEEYFVILKDGTKQPVKIGLQNETAFEITEGLSEGQEIQQVDFLKLIENRT